MVVPVGAPPSGLHIGSYSSWLDFRVKRILRVSVRRAQRATEARILVPDQPFSLAACCIACETEQPLEVDWRWSYEVSGVRVPNWREHLRCPGCGLNNRMRAAVHYLLQTGSDRPGPIYIAEALTPLARFLVRKVPDCRTSEYLGAQATPGAVVDGVRHEDLSSLSFGDTTFAAVMAFDVLEHVPDWKAAIAELYRVLRPGGMLLLTAPFETSRLKTLQRAVVDARGEIIHLTVPEYHFDPLRPEGALAFSLFGWDLLSSMRAAGFRDVVAETYWSLRYGYLGADQMLFVARRPTEGGV